MGTKLAHLFEKIKAFGIREDLLPEVEVTMDVVAFMEATSPLWVELVCGVFDNDIQPTDAFNVQSDTPSGRGKSFDHINQTLSCIHHWVNVYNSQEFDDLSVFDKMVRTLLHVLEDIVHQVFQECKTDIESYLNTRAIEDIVPSRIATTFRNFSKRIDTRLIEGAKRNIFARYVLTNPEVVRTLHTAFYKWFLSLFFLETLWLTLDHSPTSKQHTYAEVHAANEHICKTLHAFHGIVHQRVYPDAEVKASEESTIVTRKYASGSNVPEARVTGDDSADEDEPTEAETVEEEDVQNAYSRSETFDSKLASALKHLLANISTHFEVNQTLHDLYADVIEQWLFFAVNAYKNFTQVQGRETTKNIGIYNSAAVKIDSDYVFPAFIPTIDDVFPEYHPVKSAKDGPYSIVGESAEDSLWLVDSDVSMFDKMHAFTRPMHALDAVINIEWICGGLSYYLAFSMDGANVDTLPNNHARTVFALQGLSPANVPTNRYHLDDALLGFVQPGVARSYASVIAQIASEEYVGDDRLSRHIKAQAKVIRQRIEFYQTVLAVEDTRRSFQIVKSNYADLDKIENKFRSFLPVVDNLKTMQYRDRITRAQKDVLEWDLLKAIDQFVYKEIEEDAFDDAVRTFNSYVKNGEVLGDLKEYVRTYFTKWRTELENLKKRATKELAPAVDKALSDLEEDITADTEPDTGIINLLGSDDEDDEDSDYSESGSSGEESDEDTDEDTPSSKRSRIQGIEGKRARDEDDDKPTGDTKKKHSPKHIIETRQNISIAVIMHAKNTETVKKLLTDHTENAMANVFAGYQETCATMRRKGYKVSKGTLVVVTDTEDHGILYSYDHLGKLVQDEDVKRVFQSGLVQYLQNCTYGADTSVDALLAYPRRFLYHNEIDVLKLEYFTPDRSVPINQQKDFHAFFVPIVPPKTIQPLVNNVCVSCLLDSRTAQLDEWFTDEPES